MDQQRNNTTDQQRTKELFYLYKFTDFAVFCAEVLNVLSKSLTINRVSFSDVFMEFTATIDINEKNKLSFFLDLKDRCLIVYKHQKTKFFWRKEQIRIEHHTDLYNIRSVLEKRC